MPKSYIGFQGGNRRRRRVAALYDAWIIMMLGLFGSNQVAAMVLGGIVSLGSIVSTL
jgi:hypothetical protein